MLAQGGNACDAAIAVAATLAVVEPYSSGLGGGGFFLLHRAADRREVMIDARETAPSGIRRDHFLDAEGRPIKDATTRGGTAAAIPGLPAGLEHLAQYCGTLPLAQTLAPAMWLARDGFAVDGRYARIAQARETLLRGTAETARFLDNGRAPAPGFVLRQPDLAATLQRLARDGAAAGFYRGPVAQALVDTVNAAGGAWQPQAAVHDPEMAHLVAEALRRAFHDRAQLGDPDQVAVPVAGLLNKDRLRQHAMEMRRDRAMPLTPPLTPVGGGSTNTTHFSIIDQAGNRVAATLTINLLFGAGLVGRGTGVLLNNEMDDFTLRADFANSFRLRGGAANGIAPGKRPLSSMTPAFVEDARGVLALGAPGGSRIISQVLLVALEYLRRPDVDLRALVAMPRYHHQYWPDRIEIEPEGFTAAWRAAMENKGHRLHVVNRKWGNLQAVFRASVTGAAQAASDPRGSDVGWY